MAVVPVLSLVAQEADVHVLIAPDSFKESLTSPEAAAAMQEGWLRGAPGSTCRTAPLADGGEGTVQALVAATGGRTERCEVTGPLGEPVSAEFGVLGGPGPRSAVVEVAAASGLALVPRHRRDALRATSTGTGELIAAALDLGVDRVVLGLGGSATTDGGAGMLRALGARLLDERGEEVHGGGGDLGRVVGVDTSGLHPGLATCEVVAACDVDNPLCGPRGAAAVYGPQKGADGDAVALLDGHLASFARVVAAQLPDADPDAPGTGAAGGIGFAVLTLLGGSLRPGFELVSEAVGLGRLVDEADLVLTGEGRLDAQSLAGKTPVGVLRLARARGVPVIAIGGSLGDDVDQLVDAGMTAVVSCIPGVVDHQQAMAGAYANVARTTAALAAVWVAARRSGER
ncbi:glycerate kinase [Klenkia marina]|uniref:glycerate kinase n=1 Tax=Klenkia marina TaxID=1960309 RepID=UPI001A9DE510|nr:glycerate kinase [Klenkia marina]